MESQNVKVATRSNLNHILIENIVIERENVRESYNEDSFKRLKESIRMNGVQQAVTLRKKRGEEVYVLAHGFNRFRAVTEINNEGGEKILRMPAILTQMNEEEELLHHITANSGEPLSKIEISKIFTKLSKYGLSNKEISEKTGYSEVEVSVLINFNQNASTEIKKAVIENTLKFTTARQIVKENESVEKQNEVLTNLKEKVSKQVEGEGRKVSRIKTSDFKKVKTFEQKFIELCEKSGDIKLQKVLYMLNNDDSSIDDIIVALKKSDERMLKNNGFDKDLEKTFNEAMSEVGENVTYDDILEVNI